MNLFPAVDPIPLPAPVWLLKGLHLLTLALHFVAVEILIGGLLAAVLLNLAGALRRESASASLHLGASAALARRMPVVMTYVINLGVPPLLFAQVLYGRAIYSSSVLIGAWWIAVIPMLILAYWLLYQFADGAERGRASWWIGGVSWLIAAAIAKVYSTNMALMLRPEMWREMYAVSAAGAFLPTGDPTVLPRWTVMFTGGLWGAGLWMLWVSSRKSVEKPLAAHLAFLGGAMAVLGIAAQGVAYWAYMRALDPTIREGIATNAFYAASRVVWIGGAAAVFGLGAWSAIRRQASPVTGYVAAVLSLVTVAGWTIVRDGVRDLTLLASHYDVWDRAVVTNWSVVVIFFVVFVAGLGALAWLISVVARARPQTEGSLS